MEQEKRIGYSPACCALATVCAACRSLIRRKPVSEISLGDDTLRILVSCTREEPGLYQFVKKSADGTLIRATAVWGDTPGVDFAIGEGIASKNDVPAISAEVLVQILSVLAQESADQSVRVVLSADTENLVLGKLPELSLQARGKKTVVVLLGNIDENATATLKSCYGEESVRSVSSFSGALPELLKSAALNILFAGKLDDVARFFGVPRRAAAHLLAGFENGTSGFFFTSSPFLLEQAQNRETLELLQTLSHGHAKTGILITQS